MNTAHRPPRTSQGRVASGLICVAAGITAGILATTVGTGPVGEAAPVTTTLQTDQSDAARFGSPGHITMSPDAIEFWVLQELHAAARAGRCPDPARFGSPGHVTMSADATEQWAIRSSCAPG